MQRLFISHLIGRSVIDQTGQPIGKLHDLVVGSLPGHLRVGGFVFKRGRVLHHLPWSWVDRLQERHLVLRAIPGTHDFEEPPEDRIRLVRDLLDSQVVDIHGAKVLRVNDIQLTMLADRLYVLGVDIGVWGLFRRLGLAWLLASMVSRFHLKVHEGIVAWDMVAPIDKGFSNVRLKVSSDRLIRLHPADLADVLEELGHEQRGRLISEMSDERLADVVEESEPEMQTAILQELGVDRAADVLEEMEPDEAADLLGDLPEEQAQELMSLMEEDEATQVQGLLSHQEQSAGSLMTTSFIKLRDTMTVGEALAWFKEIKPRAEVAAYLYLVDDEDHFCEVVSLRRLLIAEPYERLGEISHHALIKVLAEAHQEEVVDRIGRYKLTALPVVDKENRLLGVISVNDVLDLVLPQGA